ncbi:MAG: phosphate ABC transporter permease subunit PstC [Desulfurococcales archaeon]|nr:phosphate ABC transporter permease subunit PstC [Desulfurococcales archaeon]
MSRGPLSRLLRRVRGVRSRDDERFLLLHLPAGLTLLLVILAMLGVFIAYSIPIISREGLHVFTDTTWRAVEGDPQAEWYGLLPAIYGSVYTSLIAVLIAAPLSVSLAVTLEELTPRRLRGSLSLLTDLMAATPTIIYGLWGLAFLAPHMYPILSWLSNHASWIPLFSKHPSSGYTIATAGVLLAVMSTPFAAAVIREAYSMIPLSIREAAYSLGATRLEVIRILLGMIKPSIVAGLALAFARAIGETVAVSLVIGNSMTITPSVTDSGITVSSLIASQFGNAGFYHYMASALFAGGLVIFAIGLAVNVAAVWYMKKWEEKVVGVAS